MNNDKAVVGVFIGAFVATTGLILRSGARSFAWPDTYSYSGSRESTIWHSYEHIYQDVGLVLMAFGLDILLVIFNKWLNT
jgi:hypothetical protein